MKILNKILYWAFVIFVIYIIYQIILKIIGGSWQLDGIIMVLLSANIGYTFYLIKQISNVDLKLTKHISELDSKLSEHIGWHKDKENSK